VLLIRVRHGPVGVVSTCGAYLFSQLTVSEHPGIVMFHDAGVPLDGQPLTGISYEEAEVKEPMVMASGLFTAKASRSSQSTTIAFAVKKSAWESVVRTLACWRS
jgi:hypothetical protein